MEQERVCLFDDCPDENLLVAMVQGLLDDKELSKVEVAIDRCPGCAELVVELAQLLQPEEPNQTKSLIVGRYKVQRQLGSGGMGVVYEAHDQELQRRVALKLIRPDVEDPTQQAQLTERLKREAQLLAAVTHPNLPVVYDVGVWEGQFYMAIQWIDGTDLRQWTLQNHPHWKEVLDIYDQVGQALIQAHEANIIHRDLKPENILIDKNGHVYLMDFGLARHENKNQRNNTSTPTPSTHLTLTGHFVGTPAYISPEQYGGQDATVFSDQYSFCVSIYESIYGILPFQGGTPQEQFGAILAGNIQLPPTTEVPVQLFEVLLKGLQAFGKERHASMAALLQKLRRVRQQKQIIVPSNTSTGHWLALLALLLCFAIGVGLVYRWQNTPHTTLTYPIAKHASTKAFRHSVTDSPPPRVVLAPSPQPRPFQPQRTQRKRPLSPTQTSPPTKHLSTQRKRRTQRKLRRKRRFRKGLSTPPSLAQRPQPHSLPPKQRWARSKQRSVLPPTPRTLANSARPPHQRSTLPHPKPSRPRPIARTIGGFDRSTDPSQYIDGPPAGGASQSLRTIPPSFRERTAYNQKQNKQFKEHYRQMIIARNQKDHRACIASYHLAIQTRPPGFFQYNQTLERYHAECLLRAGRCIQGLQKILRKRRNTIVKYLRYCSNPNQMLAMLRLLHVKILHTRSARGCESYTQQAYLWLKNVRRKHPELQAALRVRTLRLMEAGTSCMEQFLAKTNKPTLLCRKIQRLWKEIFKLRNSKVPWRLRGILAQQFADQLRSKLPSRSKTHLPFERRFTFCSRGGAAAAQQQRGNNQKRTESLLRLAQQAFRMGRYNACLQHVNEAQRNAPLADTDSGRKTFRFIHEKIVRQKAQCLMRSGQCRAGMQLYHDWRLGRISKTPLAISDAYTQFQYCLFAPSFAPQIRSLHYLLRKTSLNGCLRMAYVIQKTSKAHKRLFHSKSLRRETARLLKKTLDCLSRPGSYLLARRYCKNMQRLWQTYARLSPNHTDQFTQQFSSCTPF